MLLKNYFYTMHHIKQIAFLISVVLLAGCGNAGTTSGQIADTSAIKKQANLNTIKNILFFGNSLTAGYGLDDQAEAFPALIQHKIDSLKLPYKITNAGLSGETTSGGKTRIDWLLKQRVDVFVLELGANDGLRGISVTETSRNLQAILDKVKAKYPEAKLVLTGMQMPPSMGQQYTSSFKAIFPQLAEKNKIAFVPFLLQGVGGDPKLNQGDGIHPTAEGHKILAENVWIVLEKVL